MRRAYDLLASGDAKRVDPSGFETTGEIANRTGLSEKAARKMLKKLMYTDENLVQTARVFREDMTGKLTSVPAYKLIPLGGDNEKGRRNL